VNGAKCSTMMKSARQKKGLCWAGTWQMSKMLFKDRHGIMWACDEIDQLPGWEIDDLGLHLIHI